MNNVSSGKIKFPEDNLDAWLAWQETISPKGIDLNLTRVKKVFDRLKFKKPKHLITVAGTNGKGSSVAIFESLMLAEDIQIASYTSPHMHKYNERIKINGEPVNDECIVKAFKEIEKNRYDEKLTFFEYGTLAALVIISRAKVDIAILEVGLGGRLDAVNIVESDGCIITNISKDHSDWLGDEIEMIAKEKAGVMREGKPVVFGSSSIPLSIAKEAKKKQAILITPNNHFTHNSIDSNQWNWHGVTKNRSNLLKPILKGAHQLENAAAVLALMDALPDLLVPSRASINSAMKSIKLSGRIDFRKYLEKSWLFDVAHNLDSAFKLNKTITEFGYNKCIAVVSILADKDIEGIIKIIATKVDHWILVDLDVGRAIKAKKFQQLISRYSCKKITIGGSPEESMQYANSVSKSEDLIVITGSFYTVAPCLVWIESRVN